MPTEYVEMLQSDPGDETDGLLLFQCSEPIDLVELFKDWPDPSEQGPGESLEDVRDRLNIQ